MRSSRKTLPQLRTLGVPLWVSVGGFAAHEYAETCAQLEGVTIELNLSCPNVDEAPESAAEIVAACREATANPLYAKLSPHSWDLGETVRAVEAAGADGVSLVNTLRGASLDADLRTTLERGTGGYSGPALKPVALAAVLAARRATTLPIVGMGGVRTGQGRARVDCVRCEPRRTRDDSVRGSGCTCARPRRARRGSDARRLRDARGCVFRDALGRCQDGKLSQKPLGCTALGGW